MRYRRLMVEGGTYFFTLVTFERAGIFHDPATAALFYQALNVVRREHPFVLDAHVVMPDHVHLLMTLPPDDSDFPTRLMLIKSGFTRRFTAGPSSSPESSLPEFRRASRRERRVWQGRYWEHLVGDQAEFDSYVDYIHYNPVATGLVGGPGDWTESSFAHWVADGRRDPSWGTNRPERLPVVPWDSVGA